MGHAADRAAAFANELHARGAITRDRTLAAFAETPREAFVSRFLLENELGRSPIQWHDGSREFDIVYSDQALIVALNENGDAASSSSQPTLVARMIELLDVEPSNRVLEIGTGTGYNAAILARLVGTGGLVVSVDKNPELVERAATPLGSLGLDNVRLVCRDGVQGFPEGAPFDRLVVTAGTPDISPSWVDQLSPEARLLVPLQYGPVHPLVAVEKDGLLTGRVVGWSHFMPIESGELTQVPRNVGTRMAPWPIDHMPIWSDFRREQYFDFLFYLGLEDPRACFVTLTDGAGRLVGGYGLEDERRGWVFVGGGALSVCGSQDLRTDIDCHYQRWTRMGRPRLGDYVIQFRPSDSHPSTDPSDGWLERRQCYTHTISLMSTAN
jgi:protein-L-isoaspartate(D-aspartate) O-methyltransferase